MVLEHNTHTLPIVDTKTQSCTDSLFKETVEGLEKAGACIVKNLFPEETMSKLDEEVNPFMSDSGNTTYFQKNVLTATGLATKSRTYALEIIGNPLWTRIRDHFLSYENGTFWVGQNQGTHQTSAQLGSATALELLPGAEAQGLHRDDLVHQGFNKEADEYSLGRDRSVTFFAACCKTTRSNGATRVVPGSHLWDYSRAPPLFDDPQIVDAEIERGDALIILGSVIHGGGANTTKEEQRRVLTCGASCSYLRQPENQYLANDIENLRRVPIEAQRFIGYSPFPPGVGLVNWEDPIKIVDPGHKPQAAAEA